MIYLGSKNYLSGMSLSTLIARIEAREMTLTVINAPADAVADLRTQYADRNLEITDKTLTGFPREFAILSRDGTFVTAHSLDELRSDRPAGHDGTTTVPSKPILDHLDETLFTSYSIRQMFLASREIEDRAWRMKSGSLHAGFQTLDVLNGQTETYNQLGRHTELSVHAYAAPVSGNPVVPNHDHYTLHIEQAEEISRTWFVAYDGGGVEKNKCALLAEEREPRQFYGFWSYDPETVEYLIGYLQSTYGSVRTDS